MNKLLFLIPFFTLLLIPISTSYGFLDFGNWEKKYNQLFSENKELKNEIKNLELSLSQVLKLQNEELNILNNKISNLENDSEHWKEQTYEYYGKLISKNDDYNKLVNDYNIMGENYDEQIDDYNILENDSEHWKEQTYEYYEKLISKNDDYNKLANDYDIMDENYDEQIDDYNKLVNNYNAMDETYAKLLHDEKTKPEVLIDKTKVKWTFKDTKGNVYGITFPVKSYEDLKVLSDKKSLTQDLVSLRISDEQTIRLISLDGFVRGSEFSCCMDEIYDNSNSNSDFIYEVWHIVSQLTVYDKDVDWESEGRFAIETITRGGGDCEDLVILIAELLKSSSHTKDWTFEYIYMDSDNYSDPQKVNHVILKVNDGTNNYHIEATGEPSWDYFPDGVAGWYFDV